MKDKPIIKYPDIKPSPPLVLRDMPMSSTASLSPATPEIRPSLSPETAAMARTQIYLTRAELEFVQAEASRQGVPMAAIIRGYIDEKMELPEAAWADNPMLASTPPDPSFEGHMDGAINHDHYVHGSPRKYEKEGEKWAWKPLDQE